MSTNQIPRVVLVNDGRILLAESLLASPALLGVGAGLPTWGSDVPPPAELERLAMVTPIGFKKVTAVRFVTPDQNGDIKLLESRYRISETPTNHLNYHIELDYGDLTQDVREFHVYVNPELVAGLPLGQTWFTAAQVSKAGRLLLVERRKPMPFDGSMGASLDFVVTF